MVLFGFDGLPRRESIEEGYFILGNLRSLCAIKGEDTR
jgi:hypothetical protein